MHLKYTVSIYQPSHNQRRADAWAHTGQGSTHVCTRCTVKYVAQALTPIDTQSLQPAADCAWLIFTDNASIKELALSKHPCIELPTQCEAACASLLGSP